MFRNLQNWFEYLLAGYLRKHNWVAFYLDPEARECKDMCWLHLYGERMKKGIK
jgi:hypothetical protein